MKKLSILSLCFLFAFALIGCEESTSIQAASFSNISVSSAKSYGVGVKFLEDKRLEGKYVDVQVKSNKEVMLTIWEDNSKKYTFNFTEPSSWRSITTILVNGENKADTEEFEKFEQATSRRYMFSCKEPVELTFRVVVGDSEDNDKGTGKVLVGSEPISKEFKLKVDGVDEENSDY